MSKPKKLFPPLGVPRDSHGHYQRAIMSAAREARERDSPAPSAARNVPDAYAIADAVAGAIKMGITQAGAASLARYVTEKHGPLPTGVLLGKMLFYRAHPPTEGEN